MSVNAPGLVSPSPVSTRPRGRSYFWLGVGACLLGPALVFAQLGLKRLFVPWYSPALATLGAALLLASVVRRRSIPRVVALVLVTALAGLEWYLLASAARLPEYRGPAQPGKQFPAFSAAFADGRTFTDEDLRDGSRRALVFFRGRW